MSDPIEPPPIRLPPEALRRIDWLALAPWLLIFRAPSATVGWPLVIGAIASVLFGAPLRWTPQIFDGVLAIGERGAWSIQIIPIIGWAATAVVLGPCSALTLLKWPGRPGVGSLWGALRVGKRLVVALVLLGLVAALLALGLFAFRGLLSITSFGSLLYGPAALLFAAPLAVVAGVAVVGAPLLIAAIALDDADAFDAISRTIAYTFQKPFTLAFCVLVACLVGGLCVGIVEALIVAVPTVFALLGIPLPDAGALGSISLQAYENALRGFYPAYAFTAAAAIYLIMRQAIDGQPLDERGPTGAQSDAA